MAASIRPEYEDDDEDDEDEDDSQELSTSRVRAYLELFRLPNVFTAMADVLLGFLVVQRRLEPVYLLVILLAASSLLYLAGMVLNDFFDRDVDANERPRRPIPSGRVAARTAALIGFAMLAGGTALGWSASLAIGQIRPGLVATLLALTVLGYDRILKRTPLGPLAMGACRSLNVLLGMTASDAHWMTIHWLIAGGVGLYIVGLTWFARAEADRSSQPQLVMALMVMLAGIATLSQYPKWGDQLDSAFEISVPENWYLFWGIIVLMVGWRCVRAIADPIAENVQMAVRNGILSLIVIDAASSVPFAPVTSALAIVFLIMPATLVGRWIYST